MRTVIAGSRHIDDYAAVKAVIESCPWKITEVISGGAEGVDKLGERWAEENGIIIRRFPAEWDRFGNNAEPVRNAKMADYGEGLILVWDGRSKGSGHMLEMAAKRGLLLHVRHRDRVVKPPREFKPVPFPREKKR